MTGEITLRGMVLPVGASRKSAGGARKAGIKAVILPKWNQKDLEDVH
ncbi:MAG: S16 family serine protease [Desulfobacterales bacterium]